HQAAITLVNVSPEALGDSRHWRVGLATDALPARQLADAANEDEVVVLEESWNLLQPPNRALYLKREEVAGYGARRLNRSRPPIHPRADSASDPWNRYLGHAVLYRPYQRSHPCLPHPG